MKLSKIKKVMKADRSIFLVHDKQDGQWIGSKNVLYRAQDIPELDERSMAAILDMSVSEMREKYSFEERETFEDGVVMADFADVERRLDWYGFELDGFTVYKGTNGAIGIDRTVLKPIGDVELYERWREGARRPTLWPSTACPWSESYSRGACWTRKPWRRSGACTRRSR